MKRIQAMEMWRSTTVADYCFAGCAYNMHTSMHKQCALWGCHCTCSPIDILIKNLGLPCSSVPPTSRCAHSNQFCWMSGKSTEASPISGTQTPQHGLPLCACVWACSFATCRRNIDKAILQHQEKFGWVYTLFHVKLQLWIATSEKL